MVFVSNSFADTLEDAQKNLSVIESQALNKVNTDIGLETLEQQERDNLQFANESFLMFAGRDCHSKAIHDGSVGGTGLRESIHLCKVEKINQRISEIKTRYGL